MKKNTRSLEMQPSLLHVAAEHDIEATPIELARDIVDFFKPSGLCLDPSAGSGVFYNLLPAGSKWCEIEKGRDFYACQDHFDWIIGNPPFSHYAAWLRHSMALATNIVYLIPIYKVFASEKFLTDVFEWGGIVHIRRCGTGATWGFPFGHAFGAVHYQAGYIGPTFWTSMEVA